MGLRVPLASKAGSAQALRRRTQYRPRRQAVPAWQRSAKLRMSRTVSTGRCLKSPTMSRIGPQGPLRALKQRRPVEPSNFGSALGFNTPGGSRNVATVPAGKWAAECFAEVSLVAARRDSGFFYFASPVSAIVARVMVRSVFITVICKTRLRSRAAR